MILTNTAGMSHLKVGVRYLLGCFVAEFITPCVYSCFLFKIFSIQYPENIMNIVSVIFRDINFSFRESPFRFLTCGFFFIIFIFHALFPVSCCLLYTTQLNTRGMRIVSEM